MSGGVRYRPGAQRPEGLIWTFGLRSAVRKALQTVAQEALLDFHRTSVWRTHSQVAAVAQGFPAIGPLASQQTPSTNLQHLMATCYTFTILREATPDASPGRARNLLRSR